MFLLKTDPESSDKLMTAGLITMPLSRCNQIYLDFNKNAQQAAFRDGISDSQYCAYHPSYQSDSCRGDSGGPLQVFRNSETSHIVGIVSYGMGCNNTFPAIYTRVAYYTDWIASHVWPNEIWSIKPKIYGIPKSLCNKKITKKNFYYN